MVDFGTLTLLVELGHVYYVAATALGAVLGACTNFWLNRTWAFEAKHVPTHRQAVRYAVVSAGSLALNVALVYALTEGFKTPYWVSKALGALMVGFFYNFPLHRYFVFR